MPEPISYASHPPAPVVAWCSRCGAKYAVVPRDRICATCSGRVTTAGRKPPAIVGSIGAVLTLSELILVGPGIIALDIRQIPFATLGFIWVFAMRWLIPGAYAYLLLRSLWALAADFRGRVALGAFVFALPLFAAGSVPDLLGLSMDHNFTAILCAGFVGVAIVQLGLCLMLSSSRCTEQSGGLRGTAIACALLAAAQILGSASMLLSPIRPERLAMSLVAIPLAAQIALLYVARYRLKHQKASQPL